MRPYRTITDADLRAGLTITRSSGVPGVTATTCSRAAGIGCHQRVESDGAALGQDGTKILSCCRTRQADSGGESTGWEYYLATIDTAFVVELIGAARK